VKPYYEDASVRLFFGDCREVLPALPKASADLLLTDPPYGKDWQSNRRETLGAFDRIAGDDGSCDVPVCIREAFRVVRRHAHVYVFGPDVFADLPIKGRCELIWAKGGHSSGDTALPWGNAHERIGFGVTIPPGPHWAQRCDGGGLARRRRGSVLTYGRVSGKVTRHPTEKPVPLLRELIEASSRAGEVVLDPFAGVGSTGVAAVLEGRNAVLIEVEERYCEVAADRLRKVQPVLALFQEAAG
jgi:DNA modification methylase